MRKIYLHKRFDSFLFSPINAITLILYFYSILIIYWLLIMI